MIFKDKKLDKSEDIFPLNPYHPWRKGSNPDFGAKDSLILNFKDGDEDAVDIFYKELEPLLNSNFVIVVAPSHDEGKWGLGSVKLVKKLCSDSSKKRVDGSCCLKRITTIPKAATGGPRNVSIHLKSIKLFNKDLIYGKNILLLDDVTTSGSTLIACKQILEKEGALFVKCIAIGKTQ
jgi:predicted amidophosphoribosyltransferase